MQQTLQRLSQVPIGAQAEIVALTGDQNLTSRLMDLGLVAGTNVEALRSSPLGDPIMYRFRGVTIAIRRPDADLILTRPALQKGA